MLSSNEHSNDSEKIAIAGLSGVYPNSWNVRHFAENLYNRVDLVDGDERRWPKFHPEVPQRTGKLFEIDKFDVGHFGLHLRYAHSTCPMIRIVMEKAYEAVMDAGVHPDDLAGTRTGVYVGVCFSESEKYWFFDHPAVKRRSIAGITRSMMANWISYTLKLKGPSFTLDTACSSSAYALDRAYNDLEQGVCDMAIVAGANLCLHPFVSLQFARLGVLSPDGSCKVFDNEGNGYARSEAIVAIFLQRVKVARRVYAILVHTKTNCDGFKLMGITFPSGEAQRQLVGEFYEECGIEPNRLTYLEAHGTGTIVGDPEEVAAMDLVYSKDRQQPLPIGSVKSNIGHSEPSSGLCSLTKVIISMENDLVPPNILFKTPRKGVEALEDGRFMVVTEAMPLKTDEECLIGVNNFGFGGGNCHFLLRRYAKNKIDGGVPLDNAPRLVCLSARTEEGIAKLINDLTYDTDHVRLFHEIFSKDFESHHYRGYAIIAHNGLISQSTCRFNIKSKPLYLNFGQFDNWKEIANQLAVLPTCNDFMKKIEKILLPFGRQIRSSQILGNLAVQLTLCHLVQLLKLKVDGVFGYGIGELACGYFDGVLDLEQTIKIANSILDILEEQHDAIKNGKFEKNTLNEKERKSNDFKGKILEMLENIQPKQKVDKWCWNSKATLALHLYDAFQRNYPSPKILKNLSEVIILECGVPNIKTPNLHLPFDNLDTFLGTIGDLYLKGHQPQIAAIYPDVAFPVARGTPMLAPSIDWHHIKQLDLPTYETLVATESNDYRINVGEESWSFMTGHVIDGRNLFPATGYMDLAWRTVDESNGTFYNNNVHIENCRFLRAVNLPSNYRVLIQVSALKNDGHYELNENGRLVVEGRIRTKPALHSGFQINDVPIDKCNYNGPLLDTDDIYKELKIRGYQYKDGFKDIRQCNVDVTMAWIAWRNNWVTFIDMMLQVKILQLDSRYLYVPTAIKSLRIDVKRHLEFVKQFGEESILPVRVFKEFDIIRCGGIEIKGLRAATIPRRKILNTPVLERYLFVPFVAELALDEALRIVAQLTLENLQEFKLKTVELLEDNDEKLLLTSPLVEAWKDLPLVQANAKVLTKEEIGKNDDFTISSDNLTQESDCHLVIGCGLLENEILLAQAYTALKSNGFVLTRETVAPPTSHPDIICNYSTPEGYVVLLRKSVAKPAAHCIKVTNTNVDKWLCQLQKALKTNEQIIIYSQNEQNSGILGLANCLINEHKNGRVRCVFIQHPAPSFDPHLDFYKSQLAKNLAINVFNENCWGSYRHLKLADTTTIESEHCYATVTVRGDLSSFQWIQAPIQPATSHGDGAIKVNNYYTALNFRDVMTASGRLSVDQVVKDRRYQHSAEGLEFAGRDLTGRRVMGITHGALSTTIPANSIFSWEIPDNWSMAQAATIPVAYCTVLQCLLEIARIKRGETILIHSGTGAVGQAAINVAHFYGLKVYTTVGSAEKRQFLKNKYEELNDNQIGDSHSISFERWLKKETKGRGVDVVLNSLADDKLVASVRCLAVGGRFIEIGKYDLANDTDLKASLLKRQASYHGVMLDAMMNSPDENCKLHHLFTENLLNGCIKPLNYIIFPMNQVEAAFKYMAHGKHMGKVIISLRQEEQQPINQQDAMIKKFETKPQFWCRSDRSYVIIGGLGGFGMELADWLVLRGARHILLTSRNGITNGYQRYRINFWKGYGVEVGIATDDITTANGCRAVVRTANKLAPIGAVFNLAAVLNDALFEEQTTDQFKATLAGKAVATQHLDIVTRGLCPKLTHFVVFSSVSCGRGNAGQTNYGMANSIMERVCEQRHLDGLPATAIQWGAIGDVGLVANMIKNNSEMAIGGTLPQPIANCLETLDVLLAQKAPVVASMIVAQKKSASGSSLVETVANIIGINDIKTISHHMTLPELGMDSMTAVEINQTLERDFEIFLKPDEIRSLTFAKLIELQENKSDNSNIESDPIDDQSNILLSSIEDESSARTPKVILNAGEGPKIYFLSGLDGSFKLLGKLAQNMGCNGIGLHYPINEPPIKIHELASYLAKQIKEDTNIDTPLYLVAYSYGSLVATELLTILESDGYKIQLALIDGSPKIVKNLVQIIFNREDLARFETNLVITMATPYVPKLELITKRAALHECTNFEQRLDLISPLVSERTRHTPKYLKTVATATSNRIRGIFDWHWHQTTKLKTKVALFKPQIKLVPNISEDYDLNEQYEMAPLVKHYDGNHINILENIQMAQDISKFFFEK